MLDEEQEPPVHELEDDDLTEELSFEPFSNLDSVFIDDDQLNINDGTDRKNILLVEDDQYVAKEYGYMLSAYGFNVSYAFDAEQAVRIIFEFGESFDIVVLDVRMHHGRFLTSYDTVNGLRTGALLSQEMSEYCLKAEIIGLSNSKDAFDVSWFDARERHHYCNKKDFPADVFAKYAHMISIKSGNNPVPDELEQDVDEWNEQLIRLVAANSKVTLQIIKEQTMGDKYEAGQVGAQGKNAHAHDMVFNQIWEQKKSEIDLAELASQLTLLREGMASKASTQQDYIEIGNIAAAEVEAAKGDGPKALEYLKKTGKWTFGIAEKIGVGVAIAAIKASLGI